MVEFALALPVVALVILFVFDAGIALRQHSVLTDLTAGIARRLASDIGDVLTGMKWRGSPVSCVVAGTEVGGQYLRSIEIDSPDQQFSAVVLPGASGQFLVRVTGEVPLRCVTCRFFGVGDTLTAKSELLVENQVVSECVDRGVEFRVSE